MTQLKALCFLIILELAIGTSANSNSRSEALQFLENQDKESKAMCKEVMTATWNYMTNLTEENKKEMIIAQKKQADYWKNVRDSAASIQWKDLRDNPMAYRQFAMLVESRDEDIPDSVSHELEEIIANMTEVYSAAKICDPRKPCLEPTLELDPDIVNLMGNSTDDDLLKGLWVGWRDATGKRLRKTYIRYVELKNQVARSIGFPDAGALWRSVFQSSTFREDLENLWKDIEPFYKHLHAYTRKKLIPYYPKLIKKDGPLPAHLLGGLWSSSWYSLYTILKPYHAAKTPDATQDMKRKGLRRVRLYEIADQFFTSLGLLPATAEFWNRSLFVRPEDRDVLCHPSAWDFCDGKDVRVLICTAVTEGDLITIHHEMGHIQYFLQYAHQPYLYQEAANPGFHEAIGDAIALSVATPGHLKKIGFLKGFKDSLETDLNYLMQTALDKIAFLPFGYILDLWRWSVFNGSVSEPQMNTKWWEVTHRYQGICPPVKRTEDDLDAVSLLHVVDDVPYIRYFVSSIIQFQIHKALCKEAGHVGPLHKCDIYRSVKAGKLLSKMMSKGSSIQWSEAMLVITNGETDKMDASGLLEYFEPLISWLEHQNRGEMIGWNNDDPTKCP